MKINKTTVLNFAYSIGASIVIFGAWMKLLHKPGANFFLTVGLMTEVVIFIVYGVAGFWEENGTTSIQGGSTSDNSELTSTIKQTNSILKRVFNAQ
ncbi:MAG TPA: hypothetical protein VGZ90_13405 [Puia sp.]|jgi:hypothetical protein|nr:hypothetical protein [Puia sp.]